MADVWRLQHAVTSDHTKAWPLILVDNLDPAPVTEDHLESDCVVMNHVGYRTAITDFDV